MTDPRLQLPDLPAAETRPVAVHTTRSGAATCRRGHPWLFESEVVRVARDAPAGTTAAVYDPKNKLVGIGLYDPASPIRVRLLGGAGTRVDAALWHGRINDALALRAPLIADPDTTGIRLLHGPNDGVPGLVVDAYGDTLVVKLYSAVWSPWAGEALHALLDAYPAERVVLRTARAPREALGEVGLRDGAVLAGPPLDGPVVFREHGIRFEADPIRGQKTGFFLDQRDNRARVGERSAGKRVLNVFSYNGGFSLAAARGGAAEVVSVDISGPAIAAAERNFALNADLPAVAACRHRGIAEDAFRALDALRSEEPFDVVVIDPPSFAKRASERDRALRAYGRLTEAGLRVLSPGGLAVLASCSSRVEADAFFENAHQAARRAGRPLRELERTGHAIDHPVRFAEAAYLKCLYARA